MIYYCVSDIHSFYDELIEALNTAEYDKNNSEHTLIVLGDIFDRGPKSKEVYKFLKGIPSERCVLIKGNHEQMFLQLLEKEYPDNYDYTNKLVSTFCQVAGFSEKPLKYGRMLELSTAKSIKEYWAQIRQAVKESGIAEWLQSDVWFNYFELGRFIFVHSFIPLRDDRTDELVNYNPDWRTDAYQYEWSDSRWGCPWQHYLEGHFSEEENKGKTLVCGHWHVSDFHQHIGHSLNPHNTDIFYSKGIIGLDAGVWCDDNGKYVHSCNVLVIEDGKCYNKLNEELKEVNIHD